MTSDDERLSALEKLTMDQAHELMAIDILLRALIASHPNHAALKQALEVLSGHFADQLREHGFNTNRSPNTAHAVVAQVESHVERWKQILAGAPRGEQ